MALAKVMITCSKCGETFEKTATKFSRKDADAWEEWAKKNIVLCPRCYARRMAELEQQKPLAIVVSVDLQDERPIKIAWAGGTKAHKEKLQAMGYRWDEERMEVIPKKIEAEKVAEEIAKIKELGLSPELIQNYSKSEMAAAMNMANAKKGV